MGIPDDLTWLLRNLYANQDATVRIRHGTTDWFQIGEGVYQDCILSPYLFNFSVESGQFSCSFWLFVMPWTAAYHAPPSMDFPGKSTGVGCHLIFLLAILIPTFESSSPTFLMMYSVYMLNKEGDNIQPWYTPFPILNLSVAPCLVLTIASCHSYRFLRRQVRWSGIPISLKIVHSLLWSTPSKALA